MKLYVHEFGFRTFETLVSAVRRPKGEGGRGVEPNHMTTRELASLKIVQYSVVRTILAPYPFLKPTRNIVP
jgi:hypothetical protein